MESDSYEGRKLWFADADDVDLAKILEAYGLEIRKKLYTDGEIRRLKKLIKTF